MPKKKKRKKNPSRRKKIFKKKKNSKIKFKKKISKPQTDEIIYKTKKWVKKALINKSGYEKNIRIQLKIMIYFGKKKVKELHGSNPIQKLKM